MAVYAEICRAFLIIPLINGRMIYTKEIKLAGGDAGFSFWRYAVAELNPMFLNLGLYSLEVFRIWGVNIIWVRDFGFATWAGGLYFFDGP